MLCIKFSIYLLFLMNTTIHSTALVFLQGASRSGKSSICDIIEQHENWNMVGSVYFSYCLWAFNELFPAAFACIKSGIETRNIRHAITRNIFIFKENVSEESKKSIILASQKIQDHFKDPAVYAHHRKEFSDFSLREICNNLKNNTHVLADVSWYVTQESIQSIDPAPSVFCALAYCPFTVAIDRLLARNKISQETGNIMNYRFFIEPLKSFLSLYDLNIEEKNAIDVVEKTTFLACLDNIELHLPHEATIIADSGFMMQELTCEQLQEHREIFLKKFENNEKLYVVPKIKYDILLRTDRLTPQECAEQINAHVSQKIIL